MFQFKKSNEIERSSYLSTALLSSVLAIIGFQRIVIGLIMDIGHQNRHVMEEILYWMRKGDKNNPPKVGMKR